MSAGAANERGKILLRASTSTFRSEPDRYGSAGPSGEALFSFVL